MEKEKSERMDKGVQKPLDDMKKMLIICGTKYTAELHDYIKSNLELVYLCGNKDGAAKCYKDVIDIVYGARTRLFHKLMGYEKIR